MIFTVSEQDMRDQVTQQVALILRGSQGLHASEKISEGNIVNIGPGLTGLSEVNGEPGVPT